MNLTNIRVKHKVFGEGVILNNENSYLTVQFKDCEKKFVYPQVFDGYLTIEDSNIQNIINSEIEAIKKIEKEEKQEKDRINEQERLDKLKLTKRKKAKVKSYPRANIAFKCNFCNGGYSENNIGFNGVCSDDIIKNNIEVEKRTWCSSEDSACNKYLKGELTREELDDMCKNDGFVCYESQMLRDWKALAGIVQRGARKGEPMKLNRVQKNSLCVLTTRDPDSRERDRYIFGVFLSDETYEGDNKEEGYVTTKSKYKIKLSYEEAHKMLFWNYHSNDNRPELAIWSSGLHRYFEDAQAIQILQDIAKLKKGTDDEELSKEFLLHFAKINNVDISLVAEKDGVLKV